MPDPRSGPQVRGSPLRDPRAAGGLAALVVLAVALPSRASIPLAVFVVLVVGAGRWWARSAARGLRVRCSAPEWADHGQQLSAVVEVRNLARVSAPWVEVDVPCGLGLGRTEPHREAVVLRPDDTVLRELPLRALERGRHHVGPPRLRTGDVLGMTDVHVRGSGHATVTVFPRIVPLHRLGLPASSPFATIPSRRSLFVDPAAVAGIRDYRVGDPLTAIHWTATARTGRLMVKQYERAEGRDTLVCLDLAPQGYPRGTLRASVELAITVAASVLHHCVLGERLAAGLRAAPWSRDGAVASFAPRTGADHLRRMLEVLAIAEAGASIPLAALLADLRHLPTGTTVLAVTGTLDADVAAHLLRLARAGVPVAVALTGPSAAADALTVGDLWLPVYRVVDAGGVGGLAA